MLIGVKKRFVFIANSKTGSTSIESVLTEHAEINQVGSSKRKHISWQAVRSEYAFLFDNSTYSPETFFRFGVVREPADWVRSWYNYRRFNKKANIPSNMTFDAFWNSHDWIKTAGQKERFVDDDDVCRFDLIIPLEELKNTLPVVLNALGIKGQVIPTRNKSKGELSRSEIPNGLINDINEYYHDDWLFYNEWRDNHKAKLQQAMDKITKMSGSHAIGNCVNRIPQGIRVKKLKNDLIETAKLLSLPEDFAQHKAAEIKGLLILKSDCASKGLRLIVSDGDGEKEAFWHLPSPKLSAEFPNNPHAAFARFKAKGIRLKKGKSVEICLVEEDGTRHVVFKVEHEE
jgi:hypothetical protein